MGSQPSSTEGELELPSTSRYSGTYTLNEQEIKGEIAIELTKEIERGADRMHTRPMAS